MLGDLKRKGDKTEERRGEERTDFIHCDLVFIIPNVRSSLINASIQFNCIPFNVTFGLKDKDTIPTEKFF